MSQESFLSSVSLFSSLDDEEHGDLLRSAEPFACPAGHTLFGQGDPADGMYVLEHGRVQLWARLLGEHEIELAQVGPGAVLGEFALIDRGVRSASAEALEPVQGYYFSHRSFERLRADHRSSARKMMHELRMSLCRHSRTAAKELGQSAPAFYEHTQRSASARPTGEPVRSLASELDLSRLRVLPFFVQFSPAELQPLLAPLPVWTMPRGHVLFSEGDPKGSAFITVRGAVEVMSGCGDRWRRQAILGPGKLFGLVAPLDGGLRETCVAVRENAIVVELPEAELQRHVQSDNPTSGKLVDAVHAALSEALRATNRTLLAQLAMGRNTRRKKRSTIEPPTPNTSSV